MENNLKKINLKNLNFKNLKNLILKINSMVDL